VLRKDFEREFARRYRARGYALRTIAAELGVALSSVSVWVRDVPVPDESDPARASPEEPTSETVEESSELRRCGRCDDLRPVSAFNRYKDGYQWWCRECFREYFRRRGALHIQQVTESRTRRRELAQEQVYRYLTQHPCTDCGERDPVVLEFDHVGEKAENVGDLVNYGASASRIEAEIKHCEVTCANCHRKRTAWRNRSWRLDPTVLDTRPLQPAQISNMKRVLAELRTAQCIDCGERDLIVLEFDHVGTKRAAVSVMAWQGYSQAAIESEIRECVVRCANCHRRRTAESAGHFRHKRSAIM
jgi:ferredoxin